MEKFSLSFGAALLAGLVCGHSSLLSAAPMPAQESIEALQAQMAQFSRQITQLNQRVE